MYLGLDLGTTGLKAIVIDETQTVVASATAEIGVSRPHPGWSEQDPADWIVAARGALGHLTEQADMAAIKGIGLSGHMHGGQIRPFGRPIYAPSRHGTTYAYGHHQLDGRHLVVSGGLGCSTIPLRIGIVPEITVVDLSAG